MLTNKTHWENFYQTDGGRRNASLFAYYCLWMMPDGTLLEIGAGQGHDCALFQSTGKISTIAVERSHEAIKYIKDNKKSSFYVEGDILEIGNYLFRELDSVYSRFSMHCFTDEEQEEIIQKVHLWLKPKGMFFIEARSIKDDLYGKGEQVGRNAFINGHYRNFIVKEELEQELKRVGFEIVESLESNGLAKYKEEDPVVIRVIARKKC